MTPRERASPREKGLKKRTVASPAVSLGAASTTSFATRQGKAHRQHCRIFTGQFKERHRVKRLVSNGAVTSPQCTCQADNMAPAADT